MKDNEMRIVIAEKCGFCGGNITKNQDDSWCDKCDKKGCHPSHTFPDYPNDLNAMREVITDVKILPLSKRDLYLQALAQITQRSRMATVGWTNTTATARQRAEAFIKTVCPEKWKGDA
jgi:hypothetical protein